MRTLVGPGVLRHNTCIDNGAPLLVGVPERATDQRVEIWRSLPRAATQLADGRLELRLKRAWREVTTAFVFTPHEIIERLVEIIPRPRALLTRYFEFLAPAFAARSGIMPLKAATSGPDRSSSAPAKARLGVAPSPAGDFEADPPAHETFGA